MTAAPPLPMDLAEALEFSRYAARLLAAAPELAGGIDAALGAPFDWNDEATDAISNAADAASLGVELRRLRQRVLLATLVRDLTGRADLVEVCATMTTLAEVAIGAAVDAHHRALAAMHGEPLAADTHAPQRLIVVGMGKLGGGELNVSSDIDLVFVYPEDGATQGARPIANQDFFDRLGRRVIATLADVSPEGFVFRVDMRLRPYGGSGPLSASFAMLEQYLVTQGRAWERYAWLKARPLTGDRAVELERMIAPFVFRKYLDFDAYAGLRDVHRQIREQGRLRSHGDNIKLGPGGIREIEFIVQALQLVRGGREPPLRARGTLPALAALGARGLLPAPAVVELRDAYAFLRKLEHRLQYRDDQQTHELPWDGAGRTLLARAMGCADADAFARAIGQHRAAALRHFDAVFADESPDGDDPMTSIWLAPAQDDTRLATLAAAGFDDPAIVIASLARLRESQRYRQLPTLSRQRFDILVPQLLRAASGMAAPQAVFMRLLALLETISGRSAYLALLVEHPPVLPRLAQLLSASAWAADYLMRQPILLDELLDSSVLLTKPDPEAWRRELDALLGAVQGDAEREMDVLRHFHHAQTFRLLAQDLSGQLSVERLADNLSSLADILLAAALRGAWRQLHGPAAPPPRFAIIAYGKLGGKELGYASDLDVVFLYDDEGKPADHDEQLRYARLVQRINTWLTSTTSAGSLYETDLRLRPDGASGLLVSSFAAFRNYQRENAWTWEHQALTRARFCAGDAALGAAFEAERCAILRLPRDRGKLRDDVITMRQKIFAGHPNRSAQFDLKHDPGGMVDIEFIVQYLVLAQSAVHAELTVNSGNIALLGRAAVLDLIPATRADAVAQAYRDYRRLQHQLRLQGAPQARVDADAQAPHRDAVNALWATVFAAPWNSAKPPP